MCVAGKMRFVKISGILILMFVLGNAKKKHRILREGDGLHFPQRPLSRTVAERYVFNRPLYFLYRLAVPLYPPGAGLNPTVEYKTLPNGDLNKTLLLTFDGVCHTLKNLYEVVPEEGKRAVYTFNGQFFATGEGVTGSFFSCHPEDYVFTFFCLDKTQEIVRNGRRVFCDGPYGIIFAVYYDPPDRVRWCAAEKDLWKNYRLSFDNEFMRFIHVGPRCD